MDLQDGAVRLPMAWDSPAEHFALVGDLMLRLKSEGSKMLWLAGKNVTRFVVFVVFVVVPQIALAIGVLTSNRRGGRRTTLADWTWHAGCHCWAPW